MANQIVEVELISNPEIVRSMTMASFKNNQNKWRIRGSVAETAQIAPKKNVGPVAPKPQIKSVEPENFPGVEDVFDDGVAKTPEEPAPAPIPQVVVEEPTGVIDGLRTAYKDKFGKDPDKRWGMAKLREKLSEEPQTEVPATETPAV